MKYLKILKTIIKEEESRIKDDILSRSVKVTSALSKLLCSDAKNTERAMDEIEELVKDIKVLSYKPSTFRIIFQNDNYFDLIYDPINNKDNISEKDYFRLFMVTVDGKKYHLINNSEFDQAMDYINGNLKNADPIKNNSGTDDETNSEEIPEPEVSDNNDDDDDENSKDKK